jgi:hypothetical protein
LSWKNFRKLLEGAHEQFRPVANKILDTNGSRLSHIDFLPPELVENIPSRFVARDALISLLSGYG